MAQEGQTKNNLALFGGERAVKSQQEDMFKWPIVTERHEQAVLKVLRSGKMSGFDVTKEFEKKYAQLLGREYGLAYHNGTAAILGALYGLDIGVGDEVISPSLTYWATAAPAYNLGATPVFTDVEPETICIDPKDIEHRITPRTKAIIVVHYAGMPADMDSIIKIAEKHNLKILEDCSHAHGALYKGKEAGTFGDASVFSLMTGKSLAIGEGGILFTDDRKVYERAILFGHYIRHDEITLEELKPFAGLPSGGYKHRMHQLSSAFGLVQLELYPGQMAEIDRAMNYFCGHGRPTRIACLDESANIDKYIEKLPVSESINLYVFEVPWFKRYLPEIIEEHANAYKKVIRNYKALLADDTGKDEEAGGYSSFFSSQTNTQ